MYFLVLAILVLTLPIFFQLYFGSNKRQVFKLPFWFVSSVAVFLQVLCIYVAFIISLKGQLANGVTSLSPGFIIFELPFFLVLIFLIFYQKAQTSVDNSK